MIKEITLTLNEESYVDFLELVKNFPLLSMEDTTESSTEREDLLNHLLKTNETLELYLRKKLLE